MLTFFIFFMAKTAICLLVGLILKGNWGRRPSSSYWSLLLRYCLRLSLKLGFLELRIFDWRLLVFFYALYRRGFTS